jgi:hypothetical protein
VKAGNYYGEAGKKDKGKKFSDVLSDIQMTANNSENVHENKNDLAKAVRGSAVFERIQQYLSKEWKETGKEDSMKADMRAGAYQAQDMGSANGPPRSIATGPGAAPKSAVEQILNVFESSKNASYSSSRGTVDASSARPGEFVTGKGIKTVQGGYVKDSAKNAGGGRLDTIVSNDAEVGDYIAQGPRTTLTTTQTLRPNIPIAGGEDIRPTPQKSVVSDSVFETFSQVPEESRGHFMAPNSGINRLNRQNETIRYM